MVGTSDSKNSAALRPTGFDGDNQSQGKIGTQMGLRKITRYCCSSKLKKHYTSNLRSKHGELSRENASTSIGFPTRLSTVSRMRHKCCVWDFINTRSGHEAKSDTVHSTKNSLSNELIQKPNAFENTPLLNAYCMFGTKIGESVSDRKICSVVCLLLDELKARQLDPSPGPCECRDPT